jgi:hypothetical protein
MKRDLTNMRHFSVWMPWARRYLFVSPAWSNCWHERTRWTLENKPLPYIGWAPDHSPEIRIHRILIGPFKLTLAWLTEEH